MKLHKSINTMFFFGLVACLPWVSCTPDMSPPITYSQPQQPAKPKPRPTQPSGGSGPVRQNPSTQLTSDFGKNTGVTVSRVAAAGPYVALTFDDGPHSVNTPRLLNILRDRNVKATFYVIGKSVDLHPGIVRRTVAEGHEIGNHTYNHPKLSSMSMTAVNQELKRTEESIARACGVTPKTMRPPYGALLQTQRQSIYDSFGYPTIMWSVDPLDWRRPGASVVTSRILSGTTQGGIILLHDLHASSVDAVPGVIDGLLRKGFRFVTVSQLLAMGGNAPAAQ
jgi:peptidoglycan-N-acetylglucosamine deacetylase